MVDVHTQKPVRVIPGGDGYGPHLVLPEDLLDRVRELLEQHQIPHWVESQRISLDNKPFTAVINFGLYGDGDRVQSLLDEAE